LTFATSSSFALGTLAGTTEDATAKLKETLQVALGYPEVHEEFGEDHVPDELMGSEELCI
jgi:tripartite-type tricarboxylate transporter receptor subunit TctC